MEVSEVSCELPAEFMEQLLEASDAPPVFFEIDALLGQRLARAKARLDRLERDLVTRDYSALATARVEFALASRAMADHLMACGLSVSEND
ncbi:hypothetical protein [Halomonas korlensis]|uniref:Uncharacterized protein n=1 Tax=Halomonas korlensis TaxID=463301 RepID=A0A1I7H9A3_9GAMM|nr:hypothetical protein [Halomonas korlensis]SFU57210.1 hypothetical protein SAMN04487955_10461 [Halomonas korlensis]